MAMYWIVSTAPQVTECGLSGFPNFSPAQAPEPRQAAMSAKWADLAVWRVLAC